MSKVALVVFKDSEGWHIRLSKRMKARPYSTLANIIESAINAAGYTYSHEHGKNGWRIVSYVGDGSKSITPVHELPVERIQKLANRLAALVPEWSEVRMQRPYVEGDGRFSGLPGTDPRLYPERYSDAVAPEPAPATVPPPPTSEEPRRRPKAGRAGSVAASMDAGVRALRRELESAERAVKAAEAAAKAANDSWLAAIERRDQLVSALAKLES